MVYYLEYVIQTGFGEKTTYEFKPPYKNWWQENVIFFIYTNTLGLCNSLFLLLTWSIDFTFFIELCKDQTS